MSTLEVAAIPMKRKKKYRRDLEGEPPPITKYGRKKIERRREESPLADALLEALEQAKPATGSTSHKKR